MRLTTRASLGLLVALAIVGVLELVSAAAWRLGASNIRFRGRDYTPNGACGRLSGVTLVPLRGWPGLRKGQEALGEGSPEAAPGVVFVLRGHRVCLSSWVLQGGP